MASRRTSCATLSDPSVNSFNSFQSRGGGGLNAQTISQHKKIARVLPPYFKPLVLRCRNQFLSSASSTTTDDDDVDAESDAWCVCGNWIARVLLLTLCFDATFHRVRDSCSVQTATNESRRENIDTRKRTNERTKDESLFFYKP